MLLLWYFWPDACPRKNLLTTLLLAGLALGLAPRLLWLAQQQEEHKPLLYTGLGYQYWVGVNQAQGRSTSGEQAYQAATGDTLPQHYYGVVYPRDGEQLKALAWQNIQERPGAYLLRVGRAALFALAPPGPPWTRPLAYGLGNGLLLLLLVWGARGSQGGRLLLHTHSKTASWVLLTFLALVAPPLLIGLTGAYLLFGLPLLTAFTGLLVGERLHLKTEPPLSQK